MPGQEEPHHVYTEEGVFVEGYKLAEQAEHSAKNRNKEAERLGIKTRYKTSEV